MKHRFSRSTLKLDRTKLIRTSPEKLNGNYGIHEPIFLRSSFIIFFCLLFVGYSFGQPGTIDAKTLPFNPGSGASGTVLATCIQADGKILIGGSFTIYNGTAVNRITRINSDGSLDPSFNVGTGVNDYVRSSALQPDGKFIIGGNFTSYNGTPRNRIARINADGTLDESFNPGTGANNTVYSIIIQTDGKIIIGGGFTMYNGIINNRVIRLNADGSQDNTFSVGSGADDTILSMSFQPDGKVIVGGYFTNFNNKAFSRIARLNNEGSLDTSFNPGIGANGTILFTKLQPNGKIIICGMFTSFNGTSSGRVARLKADGSMDELFNVGSGADADTYTITLQTDGNIIFTGDFTSFSGVVQKAIVRLKEDGSFDSTYDPGTSVNNFISTTALRPDGKMIVGGAFSSFRGNTSLSRIALIDSDGSIPGFFNRSSSTGVINSISIQTDNKIIIGGSMVNFNSSSQNHLVRLNFDGTVDNTLVTGAGPNASISATAVQADKLLIGGYFTAYNGTTQNRIARINTDGSLDNSFSSGTGANGVVFAIALQPDGKIIIGGDFTAYKGSAASRIVRLNQDGTPDNTFNFGTGTNSTVRSISVQADSKIIICGNFTQYNGTTRNYIARLNSDGSLDNSFTASTNGVVNAVSIQTGGKIIIGGLFSSCNDQVANNVARLNTDGSLDNTFKSGSGSGGSIYAMDIQTDGKIILGGSFTSFNSVGLKNIARLHSDGSLDITFDSGVGSNSYLYTVKVQRNGKLLIGGVFSAYNGDAVNLIARINGGKANQSILFPELNSKKFGEPSFDLLATSSSGLPLNYSSNNSSVAAISANKLNIIASGSATINAFQSGDEDYNRNIGISRFISIKKADQTIDFAPIENKEMGVSPFTLSASSSSGLPINYSSSDLTVATVSGNTITLVGPGSSTISVFQPGDANHYEAPTVNQKLVVLYPRPLAQPTQIVLKTTTTTSIDGSFTASAGSPSGYIVLRKANMSADDIPADGSTYTSGSDLGTSKVVAIGNSLSFNDSGLSAGVVYYYGVFSYNGKDAFINYLTELPLKSSLITLPVAPAAIDAINLLPNSFKAKWTETQSATSYELDVSLSPAFDSFIAGYEGKNILALEETVGTLLANKTYYYRVRARNAGGLSANSNIISITTPKEGNPLAISTVTTSIAGDNINFSFSLSGGSGARLVQLNYRSILGNTFSVVDINSTTNAYQISIAKSFLDKIGLEYFVTASDPTTPLKSIGYIYTNVSQSIPNLSAGGQAENYRIISIPAAMSSSDTRTVFNSAIIQYNGYDKEKWRLLHYQPGDPRGQNIDFEGITKIEAGLGYWFNSIDKIDIGINGTTVQANQSAPFELKLTKGWNQIGNPYTFNISWSDILVFNNNPTDVGSKFYEYDAANISFKSNDLITAWSGGFVKATANATVKIPVTVKQTTGGRKANVYQIDNSKLDEPEWFLPLTLHQGSAYNEMGGIGMHPLASESNDRYDEQSLPRFQNYLELNSYHPEFFIPRFSRDVVPSADQYQWNYTIESNFKKSEAVLTWNVSSLGDNEAQLMLFDNEAGELIDMKKAGEYRFMLESTHNIKLLYSKNGESIKPDVSGIGKPYPNPSNQQVTIPFFIGTNTQFAQITWYDLKGKRIKEVTHQNPAAGFYQTVWNGDDDQGNRLAEGVYLIRFISSDREPIVKRVILK